MCTNQGFKSLVPGPSVNTRYLYWCMRHMAPRIADMGSGATFKEVSKAVMERVVIPLPPFPDQVRIAAILDKADSVRRHAKLAAALPDEVVTSLVHHDREWFSDVADSGTVALESLCQIVTKGTTPKTLGRSYAKRGIPFLRAENLQGGAVDLTGC